MKLRNININSKNATPPIIIKLGLFSSNLFLSNVSNKYIVPNKTTKAAAAQ